MPTSPAHRAPVRRGTALERAQHPFSELVERDMAFVLAKHDLGVVAGLAGGIVDIQQGADIGTIGMRNMRNFAAESHLAAGASQCSLMARRFLAPIGAASGERVAGRPATPIPKPA